MLVVMPHGTSEDEMKRGAESVASPGYGTPPGRLPIFGGRSYEVVKFTVAALLLAGTPVAAQDAVTALNRAERTYAGLETLRAKFDQTIVNPMLGGPETSSGMLFIAPPSKFAMRFSKPEGDRIVADGTWLWAYTPSTVPGQVIRQSIPTAGAATPNLLSQFVVRPLEHYRVSHVDVDSSDTGPADVVRLIPRRQDAQFREAEITIARGTGFILRLAIRELSGQMRMLAFSEIESAIAIPTEELSFEVPEGVKVVNPY